MQSPRVGSGPVANACLLVSKCENASRTTTEEDANEYDKDSAKTDLKDYGRRW